MSLFAIVGVLGRLEILEVYEYFDGPRLFVCRTPADQRFLCLWIGGRDFLLVAISRERFNIVRSGGIDLRHAFLAPEGHLALLVRLDQDAMNGSIEEIPVGRIRPELLPAAGEYLSVDTATLPAAENDVTQLAVSLHRDFINLHLLNPARTRTEAPTRRLGDVLTNFQEALDAFGQVSAGTPTMSGSISPAILSATETVVVGAKAASFTVQIAAANAANLFGESLIGQVVERFITLLEIGNNESLLREHLLQIKARAASKYRAFLKAVIDAQSGVKIDWGSPQAGLGRSVTLPHSIAKDAIAIVEAVNVELAEPRQVVGLFRAINLPSKTYEIYVPADDEKYRGRILDSAMPVAERITMNQPYTIKLRELIEVTSTGEERIKHEIELILTSDLLVAGT